MKIKRKKGKTVFPLYLFSEMASSQFCPRCLWLQVKFGIPFYPPPTEFEIELRRFARKYVKEYFKETQEIFNWVLPEKRKKLKSKIDSFEREVKISSAKFLSEIGETGITLEGAPDNIVFLKDGTNLLISYKFIPHPTPLTSDFKEEISKFSLYLNAAAYISEKAGYNPKYLSGVFLILPNDVAGWDIPTLLDPEDREITIPNIVLNWDVPGHTGVRFEKRKKKNKRKKRNILFFIADERFFYSVLKPVPFEVRYSPQDVEKKAEQFGRIIFSPHEPKKRCSRCSHIKLG